MNKDKIVNALSALVLLFSQMGLNSPERQRVIRLFIDLDEDSDDE